MCIFMFCFFKQKTAYELRISDWSSDVCSSDLRRQGFRFLASLWTGAQMNAPFRNTAILDHAVRPLRQYLDDDGVTEVVINEPTIVGVERHGGWTWEREAGLTLDALNELAR